MPDTRSTPSCLVCRDPKVEPFLDLGVTALANRFLKPEAARESEPKYPLRVGFCRACEHVQLLGHVPPAEMFEHYLYVSSASSTLKEHLYDLSDVVCERYRPGTDDLVIDIGCNDQTLLEGFRRHGVRCLGVDPAVNLAELTEGRGIDRYTGFFGRRTAEEIAARWGRAAIVTATNTFPHIPDLHDFVEGLGTVLREDGVIVLEMHYLGDLLGQGAFDTVYHEHVSYWALRPMRRLFEEHGFEIVHAERLDLHHGQLRVFVQRRGVSPVQAAVEVLAQWEREQGLDRFSTYQSFADYTEAWKTKFLAFLRNLRSEGKRVAGYGAPAKANTMLGYLGLGPGDLCWIADRSPLKQGLLTPGSHIPIVSPERILEDQPDFLILFAWNFVEEILKQQAEYRRRGGRFLVPVPEPLVV